MPVHIFHEDWDGRQDQETDGRRDLTCRWTVYATSPAIGDVHDEIRAHGSFPHQGKQHPRKPGYYSKGGRISTGDGPHMYVVEASYSQATQVDVTNPLATPPDVSWDSMEIPTPIDVDFDGNPIASSAGEPFDPPLVLPRQVPVLVFTRNYAVATVTPTWLASWTNTTNSASFTLAGDTIAIGEAFIERQPTATYVAARDGFDAYYRVTFRIAVAPGQGEHFFQHNPLDRGYRHLNGEDELVTIVDAKGDPVGQPTLLDGTGHKLADDADPVVLHFRIRGTSDIGSLGLVDPDE